MVSFESLARIFLKYQSEITKLASESANVFAISLNLQLNRVRTLEEQKEILSNAYKRTLKKLKQLEDNQAHIIPLALEILPYTETTLKQASDSTDKYRNMHKIEGLTDDIDLSYIEMLSLEEIPKEHPILPVLLECRDYFAQLEFFDWINQLLDLSEQQEEKISTEEVETAKDEKVISLTVAQKTLALNKLMFWVGIEDKLGQQASHLRFIAALTGAPVASIKARFPNAKNLSKAVHLTNLRALIPLFESVDALDLVQKLKLDLSYEQEER